MNPQYNFTITAGGVTRQVRPVYGDALAIEYAQEQNQRFFRGKLTGKLTFIGSDYDFIAASAFDTEYNVELTVSYDGGASWSPLWSGRFWKTDCTFNRDDRSVTVTPTLRDAYNAVLEGMEKEYNLIDLAPVIQPVKLDKRPLIQVYVPGQNVIGCFLSGMWWEQDCNVVDDEGELQSLYQFSKNKTARVVETSGNVTPSVPEVFYGDPYSGNGTTEYVSGGYKFVRSYGSGGTGTREIFDIVRTADNVSLWRAEFVNQGQKTYPSEIQLQPVAGTGASGTLTLFIHDIAVFARYITDVESYGGTQTVPIPDNDIVPDNRNYSRCTGYYAPSTILFFDRLTTTPTKWGIYQPGRYYVNPASISLLGVDEAFPVARAAWGRMSVWFAFSVIDWEVEQRWRKPYTLKDAFPLWSAISVLLAQVAPGITHEGTPEYSRFLYAENPLTGDDIVPLIAPKSNVIASGYDQPAQKAVISLKNLLDMLRDCFRCYWFIDSQGRFRIEHVSWFMNGGSYEGGRVVGTDLTALRNPRSGKPWAFAQNEYKFDKPDMSGRYEFGWMDDVTEYFDGFPIDVVSNFVNKEKIEHISVAHFTSDIDYILLNPSEISMNGFVLLGAQPLVLSASAQATPGTQFECWLENTGRLKDGDRITVSMTGGSAFAGGVALVTDGVSIIGPVTDAAPLSFTASSGIQMLGIICAASDVIASRQVRISVRNDNDLTLPYVNIRRNESDHWLQNGKMAFAYIQRFYMYDMPAWNIEVEGERQTVHGVRKMRAQEVRFPVPGTPDLENLIKTDIGDGEISKMSLNLQSRSARTTLLYDTE